MYDLSTIGPTVERGLKILILLKMTRFRKKTPLQKKKKKKGKKKLVTIYLSQFLFFFPPFFEIGGTEGKATGLSGTCDLGQLVVVKSNLKVDNSVLRASRSTSKRAVNGLGEIQVLLESLSEIRCRTKALTADPIY